MEDQKPSFAIVAKTFQRGRKFWSQSLFGAGDIPGDSQLSLGDQR